MRYFPVNLDLQGRKVLVVGGGPVGEGKARGLVEAGAAVTLVSPVVTTPLQEMEARGELAVRLREFAPEDLEGFFLIIGATNDPAVNKQVYDLASARNLLCNIVDHRALCNFLTPSLFNRGPIQISVSTGGVSPTIGQLIREKISDVVGPEFETLLEISAELRARAQATIPGFNERKELLSEFAHSDALQFIIEGKEDLARALADSLLKKHLAISDQNSANESGSN